MDLQVAPPGRWVEEATIELGEGATATVRRGLAFPVTDGEVPVGVVLVGPVTTTLPSAGAEASLRLLLPEQPTLADGSWRVPGDLLVAVGADLGATATLGRPLLGDPKNVSFLGDDGNEVVLVTDLRPARALDDARDALRDRSRLLTEVGLGPVAMLQREAWRDGPGRALVELRTPTDLRPLVGAVDKQADIVRPWLTWVTDPTGLVDDAYAGIVGVHGPVDGGRVWRGLGGAPLHGPPAMRVVRGVANVKLGRDTGITHEGDVVVQLTLEAAETTRLVDVWVPEVPDPQWGGTLVAPSHPAVSASSPEGTAYGAVDVPFGVRDVPGATLHSFLFPSPLEAGAKRTVRLDWSEGWNVSGLMVPGEFASWAWTGPPPEPGGSADPMTLGKVVVGVNVFPTLATGPARYPTELRAGTNAAGWSLAVAAGAAANEQDNGKMWMLQTTGPTPLGLGRFQELRSPARVGLPAIRVLRHTPIEEDLLIAIRGVLHFYDDAFGPWPWPEVVVVQGPSRPILLDARLPFIRPEASPLFVTPGFTYTGGGVLEWNRVVPFGDTAQNHLLDPAPAARRKKLRPEQRGTSGHATRSLALALAAGWWGPVSFSDRDRWLAGALPRLYRDRFVEEAWGDAVAGKWDSFTVQGLVTGEPARDELALAGSDAWWAAERGARLLRLVLARIGEEAALEALEKWRTGPTDAHDLEGLVAALESASGVSFASLFETFAVVGLRPEVKHEVVDGVATFTTEPPAGTWDLPVSVGGKLAWVPLADGVGTLAVGNAPVIADPAWWLPLDRSPSAPPPRKRRDAR
jgi:hypothetical protein